MKISNLVYYIHTAYRWLLRCGYSRGFGIQSPSAYSFVRYVVNEHWPYYAYAELNSMMQNKSLLFRKLGRLYFRLTNYWQPNDVVVSCLDIQPYINSACHSAKVIDIVNYEFTSLSLPVLLILNIEYFQELESRNQILDIASDKMMLVVTDIYKNDEKKSLWRTMIEDKRCGITFDLYYCGVVFFDKSKYKQDFKINF